MRSSTTLYARKNSCHTANNIVIKSSNPAAVRIFAILASPANTSMSDTINGDIISKVIANASATLDCSCIFGLMIVIPAKIQNQDANDYRCIDLSYISIFEHPQVKMGKDEIFVE